MSERQISNRYVIERKLAGGGMGTIWVAFDANLQRRVAVKLMKPAHLVSPSGRGLFEQEAKAIAQLNTPNVVRIYDYGVDGDQPFIVMELLEGEDLEERLTRVGQISPAALVPVLNQVARALMSAHSINIVHRDLKPANLFLARVDADEVVKILDFGLARFLDARALQADESGIVGTPKYMSPEQLRGDATVDHRADLWSLGVVAYRALTGRLPFSKLQEVLASDTRVPFLSPSSVVPELGEEVDAFFKRALEADPSRRFQSAHDMATSFANLVEATRSTRTAKLLVIDDEPDMALLMRQRFRKQVREGTYAFIFATDGEDALEKLREHPDIDIALSDINMPKMDGLTFLARAGEVSPLLKVVIISAFSDMRNIRAAMNQGAFDFLVKPLDFDDLEATIAKTLKHVKELRRMLRSVEENSLLKLFVHSGLVERVLPVIHGLDVTHGEKAEATVAFIDLAGFTRVIREERPDVLVRRLNANFEVIVPEVTARGGLIDKLVGDAVIAVFRGPDHFCRAVEACLEIRQQLQAMARRFGENSPYGHGICVGIHSGELLFANIGSRAIGRMDYAVIGDVVNMATQLAAAAGRDQILIRDEVLQLATQSFECIPVGPRNLLKEPSVLLHEIVRRTDQQSTPVDGSATTLVRAPDGRQASAESKE
jgi:eukaryotic-like serine/threonine-protein kinase